jgi:hypothetical protein
MKLRYALHAPHALLVTALSVVASLSVAACDKKTDAAPATTAEAPATGAAAAAAPGPAGAAGAPGAAGAKPGTAAGAAVAPSGTVIAANNHGVVTTNEAGVVTARRENGDKVVTNPNGVTNANGVVVDSKKGTVVVPGVGTFATPPGAQ